MDQGTIAVIAVSVLLIVWYVAAHVYNRRRGRRLRDWLGAGLDPLGGAREAGWLGSPASGARIAIRRANPPFRRLEMTLLLENREIPLLWLLDRLRGKRDRTIMQVTLRSPRRGEIEIASDRSASRHTEGWTSRPGPHGLRVAYRGLNGERMMIALEPWLETYGSHLRRFHWRKTDPHITLQLSIAGLLETEAETLLTDLSTALRAT